MGSEIPPEVGMTPAGEDSAVRAATEASFVHLAVAYRKEGLLDDAVRICREGLERFPASWPGRIVLGKILLERGAVEEAYEVLEHVRREARGKPEILAALEEALKAEPAVGRERGARVEPEVLVLDSPEKAALSQDMASEGCSRDPLATPTLAKLYASQGDSAKAEAILRQIGQGDGPVGRCEDSGEDQARGKYLKRLTALRNVVQRERRTRPS